jgi:hypothetical protein
MVRLWSAKLLIPLLLLVAQTNTSGTELAQQLSAQLSQILMPLMVIVLLIALPILVFKVLAENIIDIIRR